MQYNIIVCHEDLAPIRDTIHRHFLHRDADGIHPVLIGSHLLFFSATYLVILFLAKYIRKKQLLTEHLFQPLALTITSPPEKAD